MYEQEEAIRPISAHPVPSIWFVLNPPVFRLISANRKLESIIYTLYWIKLIAWSPHSLWMINESVCMCAWTRRARGDSSCSSVFYDHLVGFMFFVFYNNEFHRVSLAARISGSIPEDDGGKLYNTCAVFGPDGNLLLKHRKVWRLSNATSIQRCT